MKGFRQSFRKIYINKEIKWINFSNILIDTEMILMSKSIMKTYVIVFKSAKIVPKVCIIFSIAIFMN